MTAIRILSIAVFSVLSAVSAGAQPVLTAIVSGGSFNPEMVSNASFATLFGTGLTDENYSAAQPWPESLGGSMILECDGSGQHCVQAKIVFISPGQANVLLPSVSGLDSVGTISTVYAVGSTGRSNLLSFQLHPDAPDPFFVGYDCRIDLVPPCALSPVNAGANTAYRAAITDQNGSVVDSENSAKLGGYYTLWITGLEPSSEISVPANFYMELDDVPVYGQSNPIWMVIGPLYAGPSAQFPGLYQVNFQLPMTIATGSSGLTPPFPCGSYRWELSVNISQGFDPDPYRQLPQIPVAVNPGDIPCKP